MFQKCNAALSFRFAFVKFLTRTQMLLQTFFFCRWLTQTCYLKSITFLAQFIDCCALHFKAEISFPAHFI